MYFNPRTHRGVRLNVFMDKLSFGKFQSTHPSWGATMYVDSISINEGISIHAPIVGCDSSRAKGYAQRIVFQSTHPSWGATEASRQMKKTKQISIHAPIVGCDGIHSPSTVMEDISIHAPIVGCDVNTAKSIPSKMLFQSTHPSWGATTA